VRTILVTGALSMAPGVALACPVCFGQSDSPMASAANLAILLMLAIVGVVLAAFATFFIYLMRRARLASTETLAGDHAQPQEGTA
jgi:hypothetical protein